MKLENTKVSIGVPVYNGARWIEATLKSLLEQTYTNFELIISDNASTDGTLSICKEYAHRDKRIKLHQNEKNIGAAKNYNKVFELACGKYFKWASSNDICDENFLKISVNILDDNPEVVLVSPATQIIDNNNNVIEVCSEKLHLMQESAYERFEAFLEKIRLNNSEQGLMRSDVLAKTRLQEVYPNSDTVLMAEIAARGKVFQTDEILLSRRQGKASSTTFMSEQEVDKFYSATDSYISNKTLRTVLALLGIANRLSVSFFERLKFYRFTLRYLHWSRSSIIQEFSAYIRNIFTRH